MKLRIVWERAYWPTSLTSLVSSHKSLPDIFISPDRGFSRPILFYPPSAGRQRDVYSLLFGDSMPKMSRLAVAETNGQLIRIFISYFFQQLWSPNILLFRFFFFCIALCFSLWYFFFQIRKKYWQRKNPRPLNISTDLFGPLEGF